MLKLSIVIPAFNEENTIGQVIDEIPKSFQEIEKTDIIVIDDGSTDKTVEVAKKHGAFVESFVENQGLAKAIKHGFLKSLANNSDILVILDADNQYDSKEIPLILNPIIKKEADIVLGDRQIKKLNHMPIQKKIGNQISSKVLSSILGLKISDGQTGFRAFNKEAIKKIHIYSGYTYTHETLIQAKFKGLRILEVPVAFRKRHDKSRLISNIGSYAVRSLALILSSIIFYRSVKFFGILAIILFIFGGIFSAFMINYFITTGMLRPYYSVLILAGLFLTTGLVATLMAVLSTILNRQSILLEEILYHLRGKSVDKSKINQFENDE